MDYWKSIQNVYDFIPLKQLKYYASHIRFNYKNNTLYFSKKAVELLDLSVGSRIQFVYLNKVLFIVSVKNKDTKDTLVIRRDANLAMLCAATKKITLDSSVYIIDPVLVYTEEENLYFKLIAYDDKSSLLDSNLVVCSSCLKINNKSSIKTNRCKDCDGE